MIAHGNSRHICVSEARHALASQQLTTRLASTTLRTIWPSTLLGTIWPPKQHLARSGRPNNPWPEPAPDNTWPDPAPNSTWPDPALDNTRLASGHRDNTRLASGHRDNTRLASGHRDNTRLASGHRDTCKQNGLTNRPEAVLTSLPTRLESPQTHARSSAPQRYM